MSHNILIVEDSETQATYLQLLLESEGYQVQTAPDGEDAKQLLASFRPDLIISDVLMPRLDGFELCSYVKTQPDMAHIPVVLLTALGGPRDLVASLRARADVFIRKPYDNDYMLAKVKHILSKSANPSDQQTLRFTLEGNEEELNLEGISPAQIVELLFSMVDDVCSQKSQPKPIAPLLKQIGDGLQGLAQQQLEPQTQVELKRLSGLVEQGLELVKQCH